MYSFLRPPYDAIIVHNAEMNNTPRAASSGCRRAAHPPQQRATRTRLTSTAARGGLTRGRWRWQLLLD
jgi:hypothetical protein